METTKLSTKGQIVLPKALRESRAWAPGTEFVIEEIPAGVLLRPVRPFPPSRLEEVSGILRYSGRPKSAAEMKRAIGKVLRQRRDSGRY